MMVEIYPLEIARLCKANFLNIMLLEEAIDDDDGG